MTKESLYHVLLECPGYQSLREKYNMDNKCLFDILGDGSNQNVTLFYYYFTSVLKTRSLILNE